MHGSEQLPDSDRNGPPANRLLDCAARQLVADGLAGEGLGGMHGHQPTLARLTGKNSLDKHPVALAGDVTDQLAERLVIGRLAVSLGLLGPSLFSSVPAGLILGCEGSAGGG